MTFTEAVADFIITDITATNGTVSNFSGTGVSYAFSLFPSLQGLISANILAGVATDAAGNANTAALTFSRTYDSVTPAVSMSSTSSNSTNLSPIQVVVTFSKPVADFIITDITPTNATVANFSGAGVSYTLKLLPILQGQVSADIAANVAHDAAGNGNTAAAPFTRIYDTVAPVFSFVNPMSSLFINSITTASDVGYTLSESLASGSITMTWTGGDG